MRTTILLFFALPLAALAQLDDNTVTVSASRQLPRPQPDQAVFSVYVTAAPDASLDDVLAIVAGIGISAANLWSVNGDSGQVGVSPLTQWSFLLPVPISNMAATAAALNAASPASPGAVGYSVYSQVSQAAQASQQCPYALLVADAQAEAQRLAAAAGARLGTVVSISDGSATVPVIPAVRVGSFSFLSSPYSSQLIVIPVSTPATCSMTVQFSMLP